MFEVLIQIYEFRRFKAYQNRQNGRDPLYGPPVSRSSEKVSRMSPAVRAEANCILSKVKCTGNKKADRTFLLGPCSLISAPSSHLLCKSPLPAPARFPSPLLLFLAHGCQPPCSDQCLLLTYSFHILGPVFRRGNQVRCSVQAKLLIA